MSGSGCQDNDAPHSSWGNDWYGHDENGPYGRGWGDGDGDFGGRSWDQGCDGYNSTATAARVGRVMVVAATGSCTARSTPRGTGGSCTSGA